MNYQIAIDGPAASGKSTVAKLVASQLGGYYVNTGEMYRTIAWAALQAGIDPETQEGRLAEKLAEWQMECRPDGQGLAVWFNGEKVPVAELRTPQVAAIVSQVARIPAVREYMLHRQRDCRNLPLIVMEGRDIGTVILPDATCKFFVTASPMERARRRFAQKEEIAPGETLERLAAEIAERDRIDSTREIAPLKPAEDSITIMTDGMTPQQVADTIIHTFHQKTIEP